MRQLTLYVIVVLLSFAVCEDCNLANTATCLTDSCLWAQQPYLWSCSASGNYPVDGDSASLTDSGTYQIVLDKETFPSLSLTSLELGSGNDDGNTQSLIVRTALTTPSVSVLPSGILILDNATSSIAGGSVYVNGTLKWSSGSFDSLVSITSEGSALITDSVDKQQKKDFTNSGFLHFDTNGGSITLPSNVVITNELTGSMLFTSDTAILTTGTNCLLSNKGSWIVNISSSIGFSEALVRVPIISSGSVQVHNGSIKVTSSTEFDGEVQLYKGGRIDLGSGTHLFDGPLIVNGGTILGTGSPTIGPNGTFTFIGGTVESTITCNGPAIFTGNLNTKQFVSKTPTFHNNVTFTTNTAYVELVLGSQFINEIGSYWESQSNGEMIRGGVTINRGTMNIQVTDVTFINSNFTNNNELNINSGTLEIRRDSILGGNVEVGVTGILSLKSGSHSIIGNVDNYGQLSLQGTSFTGNGTIFSTGKVDWISGNVTGSLNINVTTNPLIISGNSYHGLLGGSIVTNNGINITSTGTIDLQQSSTLKNINPSSQINLLGSGTIKSNDGTGSIINYGNVYASLSGILTIDAPMENQGSLFTVASGNLVVTKHQIFNQLSVGPSSTLTLQTQEFEISNLYLAGNLAGNGDVRIADLDWISGKIMGTGDLDITSSFIINNGTSEKIIQQRDIKVMGPTEINQNNINMINQSSIHFASTVTFNSPCSLYSTDNSAIVSTNDTIIINTNNENDIVTINSTLIGEGHLQVTQGHLNIESKIFEWDGTITSTESSTIVFNGNNVSFIGDAILNGLTILDIDGILSGSNTITLNNFEWKKGTIKGSGNFIINGNTSLSSNNALLIIDGRNLQSNEININNNIDKIQIIRSAIINGGDVIVTSSVSFESSDYTGSFISTNLTANLDSIQPIIFNQVQLQNTREFILAGNSEYINSKVTMTNYKQLKNSQKNYININIRSFTFSTSQQFESEAELNLISGNFNGNGDTILHNGFSFSGGIISGNGKLSSHGNCSIFGNTTKQINGKTIIIYDILSISNNFDMISDSSIVMATNTSYLSFENPIIISSSSNTNPSIINYGTIEGSLIIEGTIENYGTINMNLNTSFTTIETNNLQLNSTSILNIGISGVVPNSQFSQIKVKEEILLSGSLNLFLFGNLIGDSTTQIPIIQWNNFDGSFDSIFVDTSEWANPSQCQGTSTKIEENGLYLTFINCSPSNSGAPTGNTESNLLTDSDSDFEFQTYYIYIIVAVAVVVIVAVIVIIVVVVKHKKGKSKEFQTVDDKHW